MWFGSTMAAASALLAQSQEKLPPLPVQEFKLRSYFGKKGSTNQLIGTFSQDGIRGVVLFEKTSKEDGFSGLDLRLKGIRLNAGIGDDKRRLSLTLYGDNDSFIGVTDLNSSLKTNTSVFGGISLGKNNSLEATFAKDGASRLRFLHANKNDQISVAVGLGSEGERLGNISWNTKSIWVSAQGGEARPTDLRIVIGYIDAPRSKRGFSVTESGQNELITPDPTFRFTIGDDPQFNLAKGIPGKYLSAKPGATGSELRFISGNSVEAIQSYRLADLGDLKVPSISFSLKRNFLSETTLMGLEAGGEIKGKEIRFKIEFDPKNKKPAFGLLVTQKF